jgi:UrcA family protein
MNISKDKGSSKLWIAGAMLAAVCATAMANDETPQLVVQYTDLRLSNSHDVGVLYRRIERAAATVCGSDNAQYLEAKVAAKKCTDQAVAQAVSSINSPMLTNQYLVKTGAAPKNEAVASLR